jgi:hypothetical protein
VAAGLIVGLAFAGADSALGHANDEAPAAAATQGAAQSAGGLVVADNDWKGGKGNKNGGWNGSNKNWHSDNKNWNKNGNKNWSKNNKHWDNDWDRRAYVRGWSRRPYYGDFIGGIVLGSILTAAGIGVVPPAPAPYLCWYWADPYMYRGYWDYCD